MKKLIFVLIGLVAVINIALLMVLFNAENNIMSLFTGNIVPVKILASFELLAMLSLAVAMVISEKKKEIEVIINKLKAVKVALKTEPVIKKEKTEPVKKERVVPVKKGKVIFSNKVSS